MTQTDKQAECEDLDRLVEEIFQLNGKLLAHGDKLTAEHGLTGARWQVLAALQLEARALTVAQIARRMGLQRQSVQRLVDIMVKQGLLTTLPNPEHKRAKLVDFTPSGNKIREQLFEIKHCWAREITTEFSQSELQQAVQVLHKLGEILG